MGGVCGRGDPAQAGESPALGVPVLEPEAPEARECPICLEEHAELAACPCPGRHVFCAPCLAGYEQLTCPVCRDASDDVAAFFFRMALPVEPAAEWLLQQLFVATRAGSQRVVEEILAQRCPLDWDPKIR